MSTTVPPIVVQKYGGSSVADVARVRAVAQRIVETARAGKRVCVVVSAMGKTTDELIALARQVSPAPPRRELDMLLSCGERISMALLSMAIADLGHEAISFTGSQSGIMTNDRHSGARIIEVRPVRIQDELERGRIVIVAGFQGVSYKREITTLGRGGSDTTAVALAAALAAEYCEICSDVDGVYSADPRVVESPKLLPSVSLDEMQELAEHGAKVLNAQAVELARRAGIAIYARATAQPPAAAGGTRIGGPIGPRAGAVGVAGMSRLTRIRATGARSQPVLLELLRKDAVSLLRLVADGESAAATFSRDDLPDWPAVRGRLVSGMGDGLESIEDELAAATVVGAGVGTEPAGLERALEAARSAEARLHGYDSSPLRITLFLARESVDAVVRALHREFVETVAA